MHLSDQEIAAYCAHTMEPEPAQRLRAHLDACAECRARVGDRSGDAALLRRLLEAEPDEHELTLFADGQLPPEYAREIQAHVEACAACAQIVAEAREELRALTPRAPARSRPSSARWIALSAAALLALGGLVWWRSRPGGPSGIQVSLRDGPRLVTLTASGRLGGLPGLPEAERKRIADALATGWLPVAKALPVESPGVLRSPQSDAAFRVLSPLDTRVASDRPRFRWEGLRQASSYSVKVFTEDDQVVARGETRDTQWQPGAGLPREVRLAWQVTASRGASLVTAPQPPAPRAVFEVVSADAAARVERAFAEKPPSHLRMASLYAGDGMLEDARRELALLAAGNPGSSVANRLLASLYEQ